MPLTGHRTHLDERALEILVAIVRLNIETGKAVSSGLVERGLSRAVSSATVRSVMKRLEDAGYLEQPHTSAGRVPTDAGYRVFVDRLLAGWALRRHEVPAGMDEFVRQGVRAAASSQDRLKLLATLLSRLTDSISIVSGPTLAESAVVRVECYPRGNRRVLMVIILDGAAVRTGVITLPDDLPAHVISEAGRLVSQRAAGRPLRALFDGLPGAVDLIDTPVSRCATHLARAGGELLGSFEAGDIEIDGVSSALGAPEFQEAPPLQALLRFIESPNAMRRSLAQLSARTTGGFGVWIGRENPVDALHDFTVLTRQVDLDGRVALIAVLGPRRMPYLRALHGIDALRRGLGGPAATPFN